MDPLRPAANLSPADAASLRRAFGADRSRDGHEAGEIAIQGDQVVLQQGEAERRLAKPSGKGLPERPSLAADGSRAAWVRDGSVEVVKVARGFAGRLRQLASWHAITPMRPARAVDLSQDGSQMAYVSEDRLYVEPTDRGARGLRIDLPAPGADVECLPGGRVAVETQFGTYLLVDGQGQAAPLPLGAFDPEAAQARRDAAREALPALQPAELDGLLESFGTALRAAEASPDGRRVALQVGTDSGVAENFVLDRRTGQRTPLGAGPAGAASWSPDGAFLALDLEDGSFVLRGTERSRPLPGSASQASWDGDGRGLTLADGRAVRLDEVFTAWELDLGTGLRSGPDGLAQVVVERDAVQIGDVRLPVTGA